LVAVSVEEFGEYVMLSRISAPVYHLMVSKREYLELLARRSVRIQDARA
jgi:hypothetical protein